MATIGSLAALATALFIIVLAARQMGDIFAKVKLPLISGFLFVGLLVGPFILDFIHKADIPHLLLLDELSLAFIAFAAGAELELKVIQGYIRSILAIISAQVVAVFAIGMVAFIFIAGRVPFMATLPQAEIIAIALLGATIMIARSPSSAIAIIKELRARGPFTHKVLGATVLKDAVVIFIFAATVSIAAVLVEGEGLNVGLLIFVIFEILLDIVLGFLVGILLRSIMRQPYDLLKKPLILVIGLGVFLISTELHDFHLFSLPVGLFSEPLLICMTAGFYVTNFTAVASEFQHTVEKMSPSIFLLFFTLVGIELELSVLQETWGIILFLFAARLIGIFIGSYVGVTIARDPGPGNALLGFGFITQAGVSVGLAKEIGVEFPTWGPELATLSIGVILLNQVVGPPLLKWAINRVGESHRRAESAEFDGRRDALIFGVEGQSLALARQLQNNQWHVKLVTCFPEVLDHTMADSPPIELLPEISAEALKQLQLNQIDSVVLMLSDEENYAVCELIYEQYGIDNVIVRLENQAEADKFHELGALVVEPNTAIVSLLDQFVRSPNATSLLLGMYTDGQVMELEMNTPDLHGVAIRDIQFPHDVLILSISRKGSRLISHGYTRLELGDDITLVGSPDSLTEVLVRFQS